MFYKSKPFKAFYLYPTMAKEAKEVSSLGMKMLKRA